MVLTTAELSGIVAAVKLVTGHAILTPMLMVVIMMAGDFLGMSVTTNDVR